ncbi:MAG TPA: NAD(P)/FAD-dependent oxidoreductase [Syntrophomonadaceae bacterium]|nr:NAD(P)/FAD-dependent oxidoreductase [Syntrophomonadaceae bacterium]HQE23460.1 NAD(P)/FAD-dependent oxidoreductase [Syntrophomonadaceae bacterium]
MLFEPLQIKNLILPNRIIMSALDLAYCPDGQVNSRLINFYEQRARGGAGLIMIGGTAIVPEGVYGGFVSIHDDTYIEGHRQLTQRVKQHGARIGVQLFHSGAYSLGFKDGHEVVAPSPVPSGLTGQIPRELTTEEIQQLIRSYGQAAVRAQKAGYEVIEIISSAGYLINQFLSPLTNQRRDQYGGSLENRMRFGLEVAAEIRRQVGPDMVLSVRLSGSDFVPGSNTWREAGIFARELQQVSIDLINITGGWHQSRVPQIQAEVPRGNYVYLARKIKEQVSIPVAIGNRINNPALAGAILQRGQADLISVARGFLADDQWAAKAKNGQAHQIRKCIACMTCLDGAFLEKADLPGVSCAINAQAGFEETRQLKTPRQKYRVLVIGAGPAGLEAARVAALQGHQVVLWEKQDYMGGQWRLASIPPGKEEFFSLIDYYQEILPALGVQIKTGINADAKAVAAENPQVILVATGAQPAFPPLPTETGAPVMQAWQVLAGEPVVGQRIAVVGGGATGCETALYLAEQGTLSAESLHFMMRHQAEQIEVLQDLLNHGIYKVSLIEMGKGLARDMARGMRWPTLKHLRTLGVDIHEETRVKVLRTGGVEVEKDGQTALIPADTIVLATGSVPCNGLYQELSQRFANVHLLGDAARPGKLIDAIHGAFERTNDLLSK